jgi:pyruvate dehydrogenase E2 component (dihydrolipoamide acetyltransferase)
VSQNVLRMPRLSDSMSEATIVGWLKQSGDAFRRGEPLVEVETDKATVVYEAEVDGLLVEILVPEGGVAAPGAPIARLGGDDGDTPQTTAGTARAATATATRSVVVAPPALAVSVAATRMRATPVARQTAAQLGISLLGLDGTGPGGRIRKLDVVRAGASASQAAAAPDPADPSAALELKGPTTVVALSATGETIARLMARSRSEIPSFDVVMAVDLSAIVQLRRGTGDLVQSIPSVNDFVVKAAALALREFPAFNSSFVNGRSERHGRVNVGIAVATQDALLVPAVIDADAKPLAVIASETRDLAARAQSRRLSHDELSASTFTVSNLGMFGVRSFTAVINHPQVAILAVGSAQRRPVETAGGVDFRDIAELTLTADHRAIYGADAARFLGHVRQLLEHPLALVL